MPFIIVEERVQNVQLFYSVFLEQLEFIKMAFVIIYAVHLARKRIAMLAEGTAEGTSATGFGPHGINIALKRDNARKGNGAVQGDGQGTDGKGSGKTALGREGKSELPAPGVLEGHNRGS